MGLGYLHEGRRELKGLLHDFPGNHFRESARTPVEPEESSARGRTQPVTQPQAFDGLWPLHLVGKRASDFDISAQREYDRVLALVVGQIALRRAQLWSPVYTSPQVGQRFGRSVTMAKRSRESRAA